MNTGTKQWPQTSDYSNFRMYRPTTAGATLSSTKISSGDNPTLTTRNGVNHFSYNKWYPNAKHNYYITRHNTSISGFNNNHRPTSTTNRQRVSSGHPNWTGPSHGQRLLGQTRSEPVPTFSKDQVWRKPPLHDANILTQLTFLKVSAGYDLLDPYSHRSPNNKPIGSAFTKERSFLAQKGYFQGINVSTAKKTDALLFDTEPPENHLVMNARRCNLQDRKGNIELLSTDNSQRGRLQRSSTWESMPFSRSTSTSPGREYNSYQNMANGNLCNTLSDSRKDTYRHTKFRKDITSPLSQTTGYDVTNGNDIQGLHLTNKQNGHIVSNTDVKENISSEDKIAKANLSISDYICINVDNTEKSTVENKDIKKHMYSLGPTPLASFSSISTAVEKCSPKKRSVRFSINHQVREYIPGAPLGIAESPFT